ncbi:MAG: hypothetical protein WCK07_20925, partial [Betaproteobacteria bacterium]
TIADDKTHYIIRSKTNRSTIDNTKGNADPLLAVVVENIRKIMPVESVVALRKNNPSTPAPKNVLDKLEAEADFVISAMAD